MESECLRNLTREEIIKNFGNDDLEKCSNCSHLKYKNGIVECELCYQDISRKED